MTNQEKLIRDIETLRESIHLNREDARRGLVRPVDVIPHTAWCLQELEILHKQLEGLQNPRFVGWYRCEHRSPEHRVRIFADGDRWRILFDPVFYLPNFDKGYTAIPWVDDTTYSDIEDAKRTAVTLARKMFHDQLRIPGPEGDIEWRDLSETV